MAKNGLFPYPALICLSVVLVSFVVFLWPTVIFFLNLERGVAMHFNYIWLTPIFSAICYRAAQGNVLGCEAYVLQ